MPSNKRLSNIPLPQGSNLTFSQNKVVDALYTPITAEIERMKGSFNDYKSQYGEHKANRDLGSVFINDLINLGTWDKHKLPKHTPEKYVTIFRSAEASHADAYADDFIRGRDVGDDKIEGFVNDFVGMYKDISMQNDRVNDINKNLNNDFFTNVNIKANQYLMQNHVEEKVAEKKEQVNAEMTSIKKDIKTIKEDRINRLLIKIDALEYMLNPDASNKNNERKSKEKSDEHDTASGKTRWGLSKVLFDSFDVLFVDIDRQIKSGITTAMVWVSIIALIVDIFCYINIFGDEVPDVILLTLFVGVLSITSTILPYFFAKHIQSSSVVRIWLDSALSLLVIAVSMGISFLFRSRFEEGNQVIMSLFVPFIPFLLGIVSVFAWNSRLNKLEEGEALKNDDFDDEPKLEKIKEDDVVEGEVTEDVATDDEAVEVIDSEVIDDKAEGLLSL